MLRIDRPPHRSSDRLRTSPAVACAMFDLGRAAFTSGAGAGGATVGGGSVSDASCGAGGLAWGIYGTGARALSRVTGAVALTSGKAALSCGFTGAGLGGEDGANMAALAVPANTNNANAKPKRFMEHTLFELRINGASELFVARTSSIWNGSISQEFRPSRCAVAAAVCCRGAANILRGQRFRQLFRVISKGTHKVPVTVGINCKCGYGRFTDGNR